MFESIFKDELTTYFAGYYNMAYYTRLHVREVLISFDKWLIENKLTDKCISKEIVDGWLKKISANISNSSIYEKAVIINKFLTSLKILGYDVNLAYLIDYKNARNKYTPYIFTDEEIKSILAYIDNLPTHRSYNKPVLPIAYKYSGLIIRILAYCGTRLNETLSIRINDIILAEGIITIKNAKKNKERFVILHPKLNQMIKRHIQFLKLSNNDYLFPGININSHISKGPIKKVFSNALLAVGIHKNTRDDHSRGPCLHCLRHYFVLKAFKQGVANGISVESQIPYLSYYLGHSSLNETEKYMKFSSELFPEEMEKFDDYSMDIFPEDI